MTEGKIKVQNLISGGGRLVESTHMNSRRYYDKKKVMQALSIVINEFPVQLLSPSRIYTNKIL